MLSKGTLLIGGERDRVTPCLQWRKDVVIKYQDPKESRVEFIKTELGREIGLRAGYFGAPRILEHDPVAGSITFERMRGCRQLVDVLVGEQISERLMVRLGRALADIHSNLKLPKELTTPIVDFGVELHAPPVFVHGDFSGNNILYNEKDDKLIIVDWATAPWLEGRGTEGPRDVDLGVLIMTLFIRRVFARRPAQDPTSLALAFLDGYRSEGREDFIGRDLKRYFPKLLALYLGWRRNINARARLRILASIPTVLKVEKFVNSL